MPSLTYTHLRRTSHVVDGLVSLIIHQHPLPVSLVKAQKQGGVSGDGVSSSKYPAYTPSAPRGKLTLVLCNAVPRTLTCTLT